MGLDMYLEGFDGDKKTELGYWRKHPDLHGFIVETFADGVDECQQIPLTVEGLRKIVEAVAADRLPFTQGFFFGHSEPEDKPETLQILGKAIAWLEAKPGRTAVYEASW